MSIIILTGQGSAFSFLSNLYRYYLMSCILVPFMKEIVGYLVFQTEILDGFTLWHCFRLVADEQPFKITAAVHTFNIFCYSSEGHIFYSLRQYVKIGCLPVTGFPVKPFTDDGQHTVVLATHVGKVTHIIKMIQAGNTQHRPSSFSIIRTKS